MCTYEYQGSFPIQSMACFVEDFHRCNDANGLLYIRAAEFSNALCVIDGEETHLETVKFTKCEDGDDVHGSNSCGWHNVGDTFYLFTGGKK